MIVWRSYIKGVHHALIEMQAHKLRTFLTLLGMVFGVGAVIAMLSVGEGAEKEALKMIESMGVNNIVVNARDFDKETLKTVREHSLGITLQDVNSALETLPFIKNWSANKKVKVFGMFSFFGKSDANVSAVTNNYFDLSALILTQGQNFTQKDSQQYNQVAILGPEASRSLFPDGDAVGKPIKINHQWYSVIGVLSDKHEVKSKIQGVKMGGERNQVFIPLGTALKKMQFDKLDNVLDSIKFELIKGINPNLAAQALKHLLDRRHNGEQDFDIVIPAALLAQHQKTQQIFNIVMACVAGISLLVGGIGIMNIMLATILERTVEIGLLRALGARKSDIAKQFLIESTVISATGGLLGMALGFLIAIIISSVADWPVAWSLFSILISFGMCMLIGIGFGYYPAKRAAELDPIIALQRD